MVLDVGAVVETGDTGGSDCNPSASVDSRSTMSWGATEALGRGLLGGLLGGLVRPARAFLALCSASFVERRVIGGHFLVLSAWMEVAEGAGPVKAGMSRSMSSRSIAALSKKKR